MRRALLLLLLLIAAGCSSSDDRPGPRPEPWVTRSDSARAFTISYPRAWRRAPRPLTPPMGDPHEILTLSTHRARPNTDDNCGHVPVDAVRDMGDDDVLVTIQERRGSGGMEPRPRPFALSPPVRGPGDMSICAERPDVRERSATFTDAGRGLHVRAAFGPGAPASAHREVERVLDSLTLAPAWRSRSLGLRLQPPAGWRVRARGRHFSFGSWDVPPPPDRQCSLPHGAPRSLPAGGAYAFVFEYVGLNRTQRLRVPSFARFSLRERDRRSYECFGRSWLFRWRATGRVFQAHAYLGERAGAQRRRELRAALRSIVVFGRR